MAGSAHPQRDNVWEGPSGPSVALLKQIRGELEQIRAVGKQAGVRLCSDTVNQTEERNQTGKGRKE